MPAREWFEVVSESRDVSLKLSRTLTFRSQERVAAMDGPTLQLRGS